MFFFFETEIIKVLFYIKNKKKIAKNFKLIFNIKFKKILEKYILIMKFIPFKFLIILILPTITLTISIFEMFNSSKVIFVNVNHCTIQSMIMNSDESPCSIFNKFILIFFFIKLILIN